MSYTDTMLMVNNMVISRNVIPFTLQMTVSTISVYLVAVVNNMVVSRIVTPFTLQKSVCAISVLPVAGTIGKDVGYLFLWKHSISYLCHLFSKSLITPGILKGKLGTVVMLFLL